MIYRIVINGTLVTVRGQEEARRLLSGLASADYTQVEITRIRNMDEFALFKEWQGLLHTDKRSFSEYLQDQHNVKRFADHDYHYDFGE